MKNDKVKLGDCHYNPKTRLLTRADGTSKKLSRLPADLLELFYSQPGHYFSIQALQEKLWQDKAIEKATIARWVSSLRKDLGETPEQTYIENKRNEGYRLAVEVNEGSFSIMKVARVIITIGIFISPFYISYLKFYETNIPDTPKTLTTLIGQEMDGAYDDGLLIFSHKPQDNKYWSLYAKKEGSERSFALTNNNYQNRRATFSPEGNQIAFQKRGNGKCEIIVAEINRSAMVLENETVVHDCLYEHMSVSIAWKNDKTLFLSLRESPRGKFLIHSLDLITKELVNIIESPNDGQGDYYVSYSKKMNKLVYFRNIGYAKTEVWMYDPVFSNSELITHVPTILFTVAWINNDKELVIRTGNGKLGKLDYIRKTPITNFLSVNYPIYWVFSIDDDTVGYVHGNLRVRDILKAKVGGEIETIASSSFHDYLPDYAQKNSVLAFISTRSGKPQVWLLDNQGELTQLTDFQKEYQISHLTISEDGQTIAYSTDSQIHLMRSTGEHLFSSDGDVVYKNPEFSKDGRTLYYTINYDGSWRIESRSLDNLHSPVTLTEGHIMRSCEGFQCLYFFRHNESELYKFDGGVVTETGVSLVDIQFTNQFHIEGDVVHYVQSDERKLFLFQYNMKTQSKRKLTRVPNRQFSFDSQNNSIYTITTREAEIFLEQTNIPLAQ